MNIFKTTAPQYWLAGLPAIPLLPNLKRPAITGWQIFADRQPSQEEKDTWMGVYPDGNIGMPMGSASGLVAVDIDTDDPKVLALLDRLLPKSPWRRVGAKGEVRIYKYNGEKTVRISSSSEMICEILSKGTQIVLPPSIHPDTKRPYTANANLFEVLGNLPTLMPGIEELIRDGLRDIGIEVGSANSNKVTNFVPAGQRDNAMVWHAGVLARAVTRGERTLMEALGEMEHWVNNYIEQVVGDPIDPMKGKLKVIQFILRDVTGPRRLALPIGWDDGLSDEDRAQLGLDVAEQHEQWTSEMIIKELAFQFQENPDPMTVPHQRAVEAGLAHVSRSTDSLTVLEIERILKFITAHSNGTVTLAALRKQLASLRMGDIEGENHDEIAREVHKHLNEFGEVRFHVGKFWQWKGSHWAEKDDAEIMKVISNEYGYFPACRKTSDYNGILKLLRSLAAVPLQRGAIRGVNFANGFLDEDLNMLDHNPDFGVTYVLPYRYLPEEEGRMPLFNRFLLDSWGDDGDYAEKVSLIQEMIGATLFSSAPRFQKVFCLFGQAGSGKSVMSEIVRSLLPAGSVCSISPEKWGDTFLPAEMFGKVMNVAGELSETKTIPGDIFKLVSEGGHITAQRKNQQPFEFRPTCAHWFNSNHLPKTKDTSSGFSRRWMFLEWTKTVPQEKRITNLAEQITTAEREAIVAWAVRGFLRLRKHHCFTEPSSHMALVDQMSSENNSVRSFLQTSPMIRVGKTYLKGSKTQQVTANDLFQEYWSYCMTTGVPKRASIQAFVRMMHELQTPFEFKIINKRTSYGSQEVIFDGITLLTAA